MHQFVAYKNKNASTSQQYPFLLDIQNDLLDDLRTTVVIPLSPSALVSDFTLSKLNPTLLIEGECYTLMTQDLAGISRAQLGSDGVDLSHLRTEFLAAIDFLISGI